MKTILLATSFVVLSVGAVKAQTTHEMIMIGKEAYDKADKELNKVYAELVATLSETHKEKLVKAQREWIRFRDLDCDFAMSEYEGGSMQPLVHLSCMTEKTETRIAELKAYMQP